MKYYSEDAPTHSEAIRDELIDAGLIIFDEDGWEIDLTASMTRQKAEEALHTHRMRYWNR